MNIWNHIFERQDELRAKCKEDHRSCESNFRSCKKKAWKNIQVCVGFKPLTTAMVSPTELFTSQLGMNQPKNQLQMTIPDFQELISPLKQGWLWNLFLWKQVLFAWE